ncbi:MAG: tetratricopeptide repeat protein, partial [Candidatus Paceibacterales bacterium]
MNKLFFLFLALCTLTAFAQKNSVTSLEKLIRVEDFSYAHTALNEFINQDSTNSKIYVYRAMCFRKETDFDNAFKDLEKALQLDNNNNEAYCELGVIYSLIQEKEKALQNLNRSIELNANYSPAYNAKGAYYFDLHNNDSLALKNYNKAITLDKTNFRAYCNRAVLFNQQEKYK